MSPDYGSQAYGMKLLKDSDMAIAEAGSKLLDVIWDEQASRDAKILAEILCDVLVNVRRMRVGLEKVLVGHVSCATDGVLKTSDAPETTPTSDPGTDGG